VTVSAAGILDAGILIVDDQETNVRLLEYSPRQAGFLDELAAPSVRAHAKRGS
jgi:hypothetical protein